MKAIELGKISLSDIQTLRNVCNYSKQKTLSEFVAAFLKSRLSFEYFIKQDHPHS